MKRDWSRAIVLIIIGLLCIAFWIGIACAETYYYCVVKAPLEVTEDILRPKLPCDIYSYYAYSNGKDVTYSRDSKLTGSEVIACIAVKESDRGLIQAFKGYMGDNYDKLKITTDYAKHYPYIVTDNKDMRDDSGKLISAYVGVDKDDYDMFTIWKNK